MRSTPPPPPISERSDTRVVEDLCLAVRNVGVWEHALPTDARALAHVQEVQVLPVELQQRNVDATARLERLSEETGWLMPQLLDECLRFPTILPRVRLLDGRLRSEVLAMRRREEEKAAALRQAQLRPYVDEVRTIIVQRVPEEAARADLLSALDKHAIRYLFEEMPKHMSKSLSKSEWETMHRLMYEWG